MEPAAIPIETEIAIWKNFITMPRTARGIWEYCDWPKIGSKAPYLVQLFCTAAMLITSAIWDRKLVMPSGMNCFVIVPLSA